MTTFDSWEVGTHPPEDYLMHFRTKGSKNGIRRYQTESGEWTPLGLAERRKREGFGESRQERKLQKKVERAERRQARKAAKAERKFQRSEAKRKRSLKGLTDEEMKAKLERAKMEAEYRELTKRGSLVETGAKLVTKYIDYKDNKEQRAIDFNKQKIDKLRAEADMVKAKEGTKRAKEERKKAKEERKTKEADVKGGLKKERKTNLLKAKNERAQYTLIGGIKKRINMKLTSGKAKQYEAIRKAKGDARAKEIGTQSDIYNNQAASDASHYLTDKQHRQQYLRDRRDVRRAQKLSRYTKRHQP